MTVQRQSDSKKLILVFSIVGGVVFLFCCGFGSIIVLLASRVQSALTEIRLPYPAGDDLAAARAKCPTRLKFEMAAPQEYSEETPPNGVREVFYPSENLQLKAWLSEDPSDGRRRPAVVYLHGGFSFAGIDWNDGRPFIDAGYVLMMPMLRGENGNLASLKINTAKYTTRSRRVSM